MLDSDARRSNEKQARVLAYEPGEAVVIFTPLTSKLVLIGQNKQIIQKEVNPYGI